MPISSKESPEQRVRKPDPDEAFGKMEIRAREVLLARLKRQPISEIGRWTRDELYERGRRKLSRHILP